MLQLAGADLQPTVDTDHTRHTLVKICLSVKFKARQTAGLSNEVCRQSYLQQAQVSLNYSTQRLQLPRTAAAVQVHCTGCVMISCAL